jgi:Arc/MetJ-type ribon-helix-helix transcriptional regulator
MKEKLSVTIDTGLVRWIDRKIEEKIFANRSHAVERALVELKKILK